MEDICKGIITFDSGKGWYFAEDLADRTAVFIHMRYSADEKYLRLHDIITFRRVDSTTKPGKFEARDIRWAGRNIARQVAAHTAVPR
jgi:hypothetical protein